MARTRRLPASGSDSGQLARHLKRPGVWRVLFLYIHGTLDSAETYDRLQRIGAKFDRDRLAQFVALAFTEAKTVGA